VRFSWFVVLRAAVLVALLGSSALTIDYLLPIPSFCGAGSGCGKVQESGFGYVGDAGIPLPALGLAAFTALFTLSLLPGARRRLAAPVAILGGVIGLFLLVLQGAVVKAFCQLCVAVDLSAIVAALAGVLVLRTKAEPLAADTGASPAAAATAAGAPPSEPPAPGEPLREWAWGTLALLAVLAPLLWPSFRPSPDVPREIAAYFVRGKINVVEFVDFECPFCRLLHPQLKAVVAEYGDRVNFVRLDLPLSMHPLARGAARAHLCAVAQQRGDPMADALFESEDLSEPGLMAAAQKIGLEPGAFRACLASAETEAKLKKSESILRDSGLMQGLPTTFVGAKMLVGAQEDATLRDAFEEAASGLESGVPAPLYAAFFLLAAGVVIYLGRSTKTPLEVPVF
jgi:predicted DsbA family dithiol-disulfide isomerase/uncharacterized membrane protein